MPGTLTNPVRMVYETPVFIYISGLPEIHLYQQGSAAINGPLFTTCQNRVRPLQGSIKIIICPV